jgi:hypothetical protein
MLNIALPYLVGSLCVPAGLAADAPPPWHKTRETADYKCLFKHELLIVSHKKDNNRQYIQSFIEKLKDTDGTS